MDPLIDLHHVTLRYGQLTALDDISLRVGPGRIGLLGPNGAGKSTLLKLVMGLLSPSAGSGTVLGKPLAGDGTHLRQKIGFMPEADALVPGMSGVEYVALAGELCGMPRKQAERRAHEVLTYLELEDARYRKVEEYSTGMKQRAKLAQALIHDPPVLLLDEPTSGLDPAGRDAMLRLLFRLGRD
ncbi:MAG TPA: ABC transporter ATP-binding protein, partial [Gemmataceae bacterium]|nr:ABC transporter ATP-binding protein [Gemmataceae bacterium]